MNNILDFKPKRTSDRFKIDYTFDEDGSIIGVSSEDWPFTIVKSDDGAKTALACNITGETFGELDSDVFNTLMLCWLLINDPKLIDEAARGGEE